MFATVEAAPPDPILGLTQAFLEDPRPEKVNLGVGVFKDASGHTPVLGVVKEAERRLLDSERSKSYLPIDGTAGFARLTRELLFGVDSPRVDDGRAATTAAPGGTGALRVAADFLAAVRPGATVWLSDPTWANHTGIFQAGGCRLRTYAYLDRVRNALAFEMLKASLEQAEPGDAVVLHGACHNPTGVDLDEPQWRELAGLLRKRKLLPIVDLAYQGFGDGVEQDAAGLRALADEVDEFLVCSSYSKNFSVYRDRVGALTAAAATPEACAAVQSRVKQCVRRNYSNPAAHGPLVVETVLADPALRAGWLDELRAMRERIAVMRRRFRLGLDDLGVRLSPDGNDFITRQRGMFSLSGLSKEQVGRLRDEFAVYVVGSGRINVAGMTSENLPRLCEAVAAVTRG